jgi:hypothetical protein
LLLLLLLLPLLPLLLAPQRTVLLADFGPV